MKTKQTEIEDDFQMSKNQKHTIKERKERNTEFKKQNVTCQHFLPFKTWYM